MKLIKAYLKEHIRAICMYIGFLGIFQVVFSLYNIRNDAVNYAMLLSSLSQAPRTVRVDASPDADNHFLSFPLHPEAHRCPLTASGLPVQEADAVSGT